MNTAFDLLIGMNGGLIEFCANENPASRAELIALAWVVNPVVGRLSEEEDADAYFMKLVRDLYER